MTSVTPPTWVKHRQFEARLAVITEHEPTVNDCGVFTGCACGETADGYPDWAGHLAATLYPHHIEGP